ncbi:hypothetical protein [Streptomyces sp. ODS28]|uniref:hypothetical protein n=1 Tax=Streptomyces sp. ODS28 TaxID=3136688 RepID=UPI0031ED7CFF
MSTVHDTAVDLTTVIHHLEGLASGLREAHRRVPEVNAACDALTCAAVLLRTQHGSTGGQAHTELLHDAVGLARATVEGTKYACRDRMGTRQAAEGRRGRS